MPPKTTAPEVAVDGVKPVEPALKVVTPPDSANCRQEPAAKPSKVDVEVLKRN